MTTTAEVDQRVANILGGTDPVDLEVFTKALENISSEMGTVMMRASGSPVIAEAVDFSTFLADANGDIIAYASYITQYLGPARQSVRHILATVDRASIHPGDVYICNDPFTTGNAHQVDVGVVRPIFHNGELVAWCWAEAHLTDMGGMAPGGFAPMAADTYGEGLRLPGIKIIDQGRLIDDIWRLIECNIRVPALVLNDIRCFIAACNRADDRVTELLDRYGIDRFRDYLEKSRNVTELAVRRRIATLPDGVYEAEDFVEHNGKVNDLYRLHCTMTVAGDELTLDFSQSAPQTDGFINCSAATTLGCATTPLLTALLPDIPINQGTLGPIHVITKPGTICDMELPAPCSSGHMETGTRIYKTVTLLLSKVQSGSTDAFVREHAMAAFQDSWNGALFFAPDETGEYVPFLDMHGGGSGAGAQAVSDGLDVGGVIAQPENSIPDIEVNELGYPVLYLWRRINPSGGPGRYRGGDGIDLAWTPWYTDGGQFSAFGACWQLPPGGAFGGFPGSASGFTVALGAGADRTLGDGRVPMSIADLGATEQQIAGKQFGIELAAGDVVRMRSGGGGGFGDPLSRDPQQVADDVRSGVVSPRTAEAGYGVVLDTDGNADAAATEHQRGLIRHSRSRWCPGEFTLAGQSRPALVSSAPLSSRLSDIGMWASPREGVHLIEYADPDTLELLWVEVRVEEGDLPAS
ncbi:hydantoinase B/oxoprolinase family protein [Rhodococcus sp. B50]|uniref:hydantoinase B/oxoprolinase family protein n=1 Tax=Rhodococcus sp. B50 TaxID=2682847 RepID=UPI001BD52D71|nr:hydantoinase B/oxoprolinase family protein [Rhodococcus sp. B50]MBS9376012.1 Acetophenone carboxylase delta subunit [Rhodococcus sp. B50]